ncbi:MAG: cupin domain-containing protein [Lacunisphaera sp.]|nr:cupin domain-containing protein [Lacunisphaera sp.]
MKTLIILMTFTLTAIASAQEITVVRANAGPAQLAPAENFTDTVRVERLFSADEPSRISGGLVHFETGARTNWHTHPLGQTLFVTAGVGRVQSWGGPIQEIRQGDLVRIPPNVKHWHGASPDAAMSHLALSENLDGKTVQWMEKVEDAQFNPPSQAQSSSAAQAPTRAQQLVGNVAPKLTSIPSLRFRPRIAATLRQDVAGVHHRSGVSARGLGHRWTMVGCAQNGEQNAPNFRGGPKESPQLIRVAGFSKVASPRGFEPRFSP